MDNWPLHPSLKVATIRNYTRTYMIKYVNRRLNFFSLNFLGRDNRAVINWRGIRATIVRRTRAQMNNSKYENTTIDKIHVVIKKTRREGRATRRLYYDKTHPSCGYLIFILFAESKWGNGHILFSHAYYTKHTHNNIKRYCV